MSNNIFIIEKWSRYKLSGRRRFVCIGSCKKIRDPYLINYLTKKRAISGMLITSSSDSDDLSSFDFTDSDESSNSDKSIENYSYSDDLSGLDSTDSDESSNLDKSIENYSYSKGNGFLRD